MSRQHVNSRDIAIFAEEKVNLPRDKANEYRAQARRLRAEILTFKRPNESQRYAILSPILKQLDFSQEQIDAIVMATGARNGYTYGFTYSDLGFTQK